MTYTLCATLLHNVCYVLFHMMTYMILCVVHSTHQDTWRIEDSASWDKCRRSEVVMTDHQCSSGSLKTYKWLHPNISFLASPLENGNQNRRTTKKKKTVQKSLNQFYFLFVHFSNTGSKHTDYPNLDKRKLSFLCLRRSAERWWSTFTSSWCLYDP